MKIITGYTGEPHITSSQDRGANQGSYGTGSYVLDVGNKLAANTASANEIRLSDGVISHQGCVGIIEVGTYDPVTIENGAQGVNRIDLIVARYERNADTNVESLTIKVIKGTSTSGTPAAPTYSSGNIQSGASPVDMPLYQVRLTGITIASVTRVFSYVKTQAELTSDVSTLNSKLNPSTIGTFTPAILNATITITSAEGTYQLIGNNLLVARFSIRGNITAITSTPYARVSLENLSAIRTYGFTNSRNSAVIIREYGGAFAQTPVLAIYVYENNKPFVSFQQNGTGSANWKVANSLYCAVTVILFK